MLNLIFNFFEKRVIKKISNVSLETLLDKMNDNNYFFPYNLKMRYFKNNTLIESGKQISWYAYRQIENINRVEDFEYLQNIINEKKSDSQLTNNAYFALGHLVKNTNEKIIFNYLMDRIKTETEKNIIVILVAITKCKKPVEYNLDPIYAIIKNSNMNMKTQAAMSLKKSENPESENLLIETFIKAKNKHLKEMIAATLRDIGTIPSLSILKEDLKTAKGINYKYFIQSAIEEIENRLKH